ncbi:MAG: S41 family peptidase [Bradymonadia bacterium]
MSRSGIATGFVCGLLCGGLAVGAIAGDSRDDRSEAAYVGMDLLLDVRGHIHSHHLSLPEEQALWMGAAEGMMQTLDPYSEFLDPARYTAFKAEAEGRYAGIGLEVRLRGGRHHIVSVLPGGPAADSGLQQGDVITHLGEISVEGWSIDTLIEEIRGPVGSAVTLTVRRGEKARQLELTRAEIELPAVEVHWPDEDILTLRLRAFQRGTAEAVTDAVEEALESEQPPKAVILDLRGNPGGLLEEAVAVADVCLDEGAVVITRRRGAQPTQRSAKSGGVLSAMPLVVIVDEASASASEIVAGALQDHRRAVVMGKKTFGKGTVQSIYPVGEASAAKITVARYLTPNGRPIDGVGVTPDVEVPASGDAIKVAVEHLRQRRGGKG